MKKNVFCLIVCALFMFNFAQARFIFRVNGFVGWHRAKMYIKSKFIDESADFEKTLKGKEFDDRFYEYRCSGQDEFSKLTIKEESKDKTIVSGIDYKRNRYCVDDNFFGGLDVDFEIKSGNWFGGVKLGALYSHTAPYFEVKYKTKEADIAFLKEGIEQCEKHDKIEGDSIGQKQSNNIKNMYQFGYLQTTESKEDGKHVAIKVDDGEITIETPTAAKQRLESESSEAKNRTKNIEAHGGMTLLNKQYGIMPYVGLYGGRYFFDKLSVLGGVGVIGKANKVSLVKIDDKDLHEKTTVLKDMALSVGVMPFVQAAVNITETVFVGIGARYVFFFNAEFGKEGEQKGLANNNTGATTQAAGANSVKEKVEGEYQNSVFVYAVIGIILVD